MDSNSGGWWIGVVAFALLALALAALSLAAEKTAGPGRPESFRGDAVRGKALFLRYCSPCHGNEGKGNGPNAKNLDPPPRNLTDDAYMSKKSDDDLFDVLNEGGYSVNRSVLMPPWGKTVGEQGVKDLITHIRSLHRPKAATGQSAGKPAPARSRQTKGSKP
jgi:mono/diheme cytochrome c family protein